MTHLSEANERWPPEPVREDPPTAYEKWQMWSHMTMGAGAALGVKLAAHTNGPEMGIVNLEEDAAPPRVERRALVTRRDVVEAFQHRIQRIEDWTEDTKNWGPGPYDYPEHFDGHPERHHDE